MEVWKPDVNLIELSQTLLNGQESVENRKNALTQFILVLGSLPVPLPKNADVEGLKEISSEILTAFRNTFFLDFDEFSLKVMLKHFIMRSDVFDEQFISESEELLTLHSVEKKNIALLNLPLDMTETQICELCSQFGRVKSAKLMRDRSTGQSRGFAFVYFEECTSARAAVTRGTIAFQDKEISLGYAESKKLMKIQESTTVALLDLPPTVTDHDVKIACQPFGTVKAVKVMRNQEMKCRGFGFVTFSSISASRDCVQRSNSEPLMIAGTPVRTGFGCGNSSLNFGNSFSNSLPHQPQANFSNMDSRFNLKGDRNMRGISTQVCVRDLPPLTDEELVWGYFSAFGEISNVKVLRHIPSQLPMPTAFVTFIDPQVARNVVQHQKLNFYGHSVRVSFGHGHFVHNQNQQQAHQTPATSGGTGSQVSLPLQSQPSSTTAPVPQRSFDM